MSDKLSNDQLIVRWSMTSPPALAQAWISWPNGLNFPSSSLDALLTWPQGTHAVLEAAFQRKIPRTAGWELGRHPQIEALSMAAKVFRRGVETKPGQTKNVRGEYQISFHEKMDIIDVFSDNRLILADKNLLNYWNIPRAPNVIWLEVSEHTKTLETVGKILHTTKVVDPLGKMSWTIVGGGVLADIAAFAAALSNKTFSLVPTTLLSMIDACVGGKTGVNFPPFGKNQIGLFAFPESVDIYTDWLNSLPKRELLAGINEGIKHALILGDRKLAGLISLFSEQSFDKMAQIKKLVSLKAVVVAEDPNETGKRAILNLGHTLAHALERISHIRCPENSIHHGEAVGIGLFFCLELSHELGFLNTSIHEEMKEIFLNSEVLIKPEVCARYLGFPNLAIPELIDEIQIGIAQDKKNTSDAKSKWVLLKNWGEFAKDGAAYTTPVSSADFSRIYKEFIRKWEG